MRRWPPTPVECPGAATTPRPRQRICPWRHWIAWCRLASRPTRTCQTRRTDTLQVQHNTLLKPTDCMHEVHTAMSPFWRYNSQSELNNGNLTTLIADTAYFDCFYRQIIPHATVCEHTYGYNVTMQWHSIPPTRRDKNCTQNDVNVTSCITCIWSVLCSVMSSAGGFSAGFFDHHHKIIVKCQLRRKRTLLKN